MWPSSNTSAVQSQCLSRCTQLPRLAVWVYLKLGHRLWNWSHFIAEPVGKAWSPAHRSDDGLDDGLIWPSTSTCTPAGEAYGRGDWIHQLSPCKERLHLTAVCSFLNAAATYLVKNIYTFSIPWNFLRPLNSKNNVKLTLLWYIHIRSVTRCRWWFKKKHFVCQVGFLFAVALK